MITAQQHQELRARNDRHTEWAKQFIKPSGWTVIDKDEQKTCPPDAVITNDERSAIEVFEFVTNPPESCALYIDEAKAIATTWTGDKLGTVTFGHAFTDNFGGRRVPVSIRAINGRNYSGTYYKSAGDYARVRMLKGA